VDYTKLSEVHVVGEVLEITDSRFAIEFISHLVLKFLERVV
jgi:hypothetical protein